MKKARPGRRVFVNGEGPFRTIVDAGGVWRFRANRIVRDLVDIGQGGDAPPWNGPLDLNEVARRVSRGLYTKEEQREVYRQIGYSIDGYLDCFPNDRIVRGRKS